MKKIALIFLIILLSLPLFADSVVVDDIFYNLDDRAKTAEVTYPSYKTSISIPSSITYDGQIYNVTSIGDNAFNCCINLTSIILPQSITRIGNAAFLGCQALTSIVIPSNVISIGNEAFAYCLNLSSIEVEKGNSRYDSGNECNAIIETANKTLIVGCKETIIPSSVKIIASGAFYGCKGMTSIKIPSGIIKINEGAFAYCYDLNSIEVDVENKRYDSRNECNAIIETLSNKLIAGCKNSIIPNNVKAIGKEAFSGCTATSITIPNSVTIIGEGSFSGSGITSIEIPNSVNTIGDWAFSWCSGLSSITIPQSITRINDRMFMGCSGLTSVTIPPSIKSIGDSVFWDCSALTSVFIPDGITSINKSVFAYCSNLTSISIPNSVTSIGESAFKYCSNLTSISIPSGVTSIGHEAFNECRNMISITCNSYTPPVCDSYDYYTFGEIDKSTCILYVPMGSENDYKNAEGWKEFANIVGVVTGVDGVMADESFTAIKADGKYVLDGKVVIYSKGNKFNLQGIMLK